MQSTIILIGPPHTGKSTVGKLLAAQMEQPFSDMAQVGQQYYAEQSHDWDVAGRAWQTADLTEFLHYQSPFEVHAVERGLQEHHGVIELGALQVAFADDMLFERVRRALQPYQHVVLLLPSDDAHESIRTLEQRGRVLYDGMELNEHFVRHHSNHDLAKIHVYTKGKTPQETCEQIVRQLDLTSPEVFLIGPVGTGKSTLGQLLTERLGRPQISLDHIRWNYYKQLGFDEAVQDAINEHEGFAGVYRYWKRFDADTVERAVQDHPGCVMDFGAGHSVHERDTDFVRVQTLLASYPNVVLILPSPDLDESVGILQDRNTPKIGALPLTHYLVTHPAFRAVATQVVYTQNRAPKETCEEIRHLTHTIR